MKRLGLILWALLTMLSVGAQAQRPAISLPPPPDNYNFAHRPEVPCGESDTNPPYQVPLSTAQEKRAVALFQRSHVIVAHIHCVEPSDFEEMAGAGVTAVILKVDDDGLNIVFGKKRVPIPDNEDWPARGAHGLQRVLDIASGPNSRILIARQAEDIRRAKREKKVAIILSFEGARPLAGRIENLRRYYEMGLRELQLWWAVPNALKTPDGADFSEFGKDVIREMNRLRMLIDLSHIGPKALATALETTRSPVIVSHASVEALFLEKPKPPTEAVSGTDHLNDAALRAMARNGGSVCVHFVSQHYIRARHGPKATVVDLVDHIAYIRDLVGADHVSLGADFFPEEGWDWVDGAGRISLIPHVAREMVRRGFSDQEIEKILGGNLMRIFERVWKAS